MRRLPFALYDSLITWTAYVVESNRADHEMAALFLHLVDQLVLELLVRGDPRAQLPLVLLQLVLAHEHVA